MTPDTAALRALADRHAAEGFRRMMVNADTVRALCDAADEVERLRVLAAENWRSWEREATEHARTLGLIGAPRTGEPLSEGEQGRFEAAVERGLRKRAEDQRDAALTALTALVADLRALHYTWVNPDDHEPYCAECGEEPPCKTVALLDRHAPEEGS